MLSAHSDGVSDFEDGKNFIQWIKDNQKALGEKAGKFENFPMLIKFIDACDNLSVQVHPDDEYALKNEGEYGKTEMWYVADCTDDAFLYYGFNRDVSKEEFLKRIENNTVEEVLNCVKVKKGDTFFISAGTVHAIGAGNIICEIQQNSNTTYRVYDYDRRDKNGNARELHIEKAIDVSNRKKTNLFADNIEKSRNFIGYTETYLGGCEYFNVKKLEIETEAILYTSRETFFSIVVLENECEISLNGEKITAMKGDSIFIPASGEKMPFVIKGNTEVIISYL